MFGTNAIRTTVQSLDFDAYATLTSRNKNTPDLDHKCNNNQGKTKCLGKPTPLPLDTLFRISFFYQDMSFANATASTYSFHNCDSFLFLLVITEARPNILLQMQLFVTDTTTRNIVRIIESFSTN